MGRPALKTMPETKKEIRAKKESGARPGLTPLKKIPPPCYSPTKEIRSTIADVGLNFRVRNGNGCGPHSRDGGIKRLLLFQNRLEKSMI